MTGTTTGAAAEHAAILCVPPEHPCLAGHFPGRPIVPGVLLLDAVLQEAQRWLGRPVRVNALPQAKFMMPLLPGQHATVQLRLRGHELRFELRGVPAPPTGAAPAAASAAIGSGRESAGQPRVIAQGLFHLEPVAEGAGPARVGPPA